MTAQELYEGLHDLGYICAMNQLYHQKRAYKWWWWDKLVKITVASLAVIALLMVFVPENWKLAEIIAAFAAVIAAIILNVVPVGEWEAHFSELFRSWSDLRTSVERLKLQINDLADEDDVENILAEMYSDLLSRRHQLNADEWAPDEKLLSECQKDVNKRIRNYDDAIEPLGHNGPAANQAGAAGAAAVAGAAAPVE